MARSIFDCIDGHTCGNPVRVVKTGHPPLVGKTMSEKRQHFIQEYDWIRKGLMFEPRGHDMMSGSFLYPSHNPENDFAILFLETSGALPMCGHGTIGTITIGIEEGLIQPKIPGKIRMEAPAGLVEIDYKQTNGKVEWVKLTNVKSYLAAENLTVHCPDLGDIIFDVAYGGNFYAIIDPQQNFSGIQDFTASQIVQYSQKVREQINIRYPNKFIHPDDSSIKNVTHLLWSGTPIHQGSDGRNAVFYGDKAIDRSPCGTGTSARLAQLHAKGKLKKGVEFIHESFIGSTFVGCIEEETTVGDFPAIIPSIKGWAKIYGYNTIIIDDKDDPYAHGFSVI
ncbi:4-hydroxyproline epimerase [Flavobacteriaceae bacterium]|jgi:4-hydroxyproline epimerase|nr:4-hydroxyproline epimerase [Flavobacteriaceae bacterium]MDC0652445.1 4-hydroxyproline epimerase [Flavobacteriaceae bacterium]MDC1167983.1 4-hydroxyproline epimerase [Flavobacteriaceae bacterium]MDC3285172.1 4-hydroxyproline epimerase [Flavobacteriaceae bacterium]